MRQGTTPPPPLVLLALALLAAPPAAGADDWSLPDELRGVRVAPIFLLSRPEIQAELKLTNEQVFSVHRTIGDLFARAAALRGQSDVEAIAGRRVIDEAQRRWLETQLDDAQRSRLMEIDLRWEGPTAVVTRTWVADYLELTPAQRQRLEALRDSPAWASPSRADSILDGLTPDQEARWRGLLGAPLSQPGPGPSAAPTPR
jgi:hypothetical protein